jgi:GSH-dependent disulfide-bond oxidoreductase
MIELYGSTSPNVQKIQIMLHEVDLDYRFHLVDVHHGEQYSPEFSRLNPNQKVPVIVDRDGPEGRPLTIFESGAILIYLAEKTARLLPEEPAARAGALQWLMIQLTGIGPMFGQFNHFQRYAADDVYGTSRFATQSRRLYDLLEQRLGESPFLGGGEYTIADIATFPWIRVENKLFGKTHAVMNIDWEGHPNLARWYNTIAARDAVKSALLKINLVPSTMTTATREDLERYHARGTFARSLDGAT